jgi:hypothetical protein
LKDPLTNIKEEENSQFVSFSKKKEEVFIKKEEDQSGNEYMGLFDIIMKELSDIPNGIREKVSTLNSELFNSDLKKIKRRSNKKKAKLSFEEQINKLNVCTFNCNTRNLKFDLDKGSILY